MSTPNVIPLRGGSTGQAEQSPSYSLPADIKLAFVIVGRLALRDELKFNMNPNGPTDDLFHTILAIAEVIRESMPALDIVEIRQMADPSH